MRSNIEPTEEMYQALLYQNLSLSVTGSRADMHTIAATQTSRSRGVTRRLREGIAFQYVTGETDH